MIDALITPLAAVITSLLVMDLGVSLFRDLRS